MLAKISLDGNVVAEKHIGNTHIYFSDAAYANNDTQAGRQQVLDEAAQASWNIIIHSQKDLEE